MKHTAALRRDFQFSVNTPSNFRQQTANIPSNPAAKRNIDDYGRTYHIKENESGRKVIEIFTHSKAAQRLGGDVGGHEKYFDIKDQMEGRRLEQGRLDESMRQADMENARGWANIQNAQLDRAQRAQIHSDEMGLKLMVYRA